MIKNCFEEQKLPIPIQLFRFLYTSFTKVDEEHKTCSLFTNYNVKGLQPICPVKKMLVIKKTLMYACLCIF